MPTIHCPLHTQELFDVANQKLLIQKAVQVFNRPENTVDAIAGTGHSGLVFGSILAYELGIPFIAVRRNWAVGTHDTNMVNVNSDKPIESYAIVDDLISTGDTMEHVIQEVRNTLHIRNPTYIMLYSTVFYTSSYKQHRIVHMPSAFASMTS